MVIYHSWFYHFTTTCRPDLTFSYDGPACMVIYHSWFYHFTTTSRPDLTLSYDGPACMVIYHWSPDSVTLLPRAGLTWPSAMIVEPAWWSITDHLILSLYYNTCRPDLTFIYDDLEPAWWSITDLLILSLYYTTCRPDLTFSSDGRACLVIYHWSPDSITLLYHVQAWPDLCLSAWIFALP